MISAREFILQWKNENEDSPLDAGLLSFDAAMLDEVEMPQVDRAFLVEAGLPESAAPYMNFERPTEGSLPTLSAHFGLPDAFRRYRVIGSNGSGDPICIDQEQNGAVISINHDNNYRPIFMNTSIPQLAESLLLYRKLVRRTTQEVGDDAFMDNNIPTDLRVWIAHEMERVDASALAGGCVWCDELASLNTPYT